RNREYRGEFPLEFRLSPDDLLIVMTCQTAEGEILGLPGLVPEDGRTYLHNQRIGLVCCDPQKINKRFAFYLFLSEGVNRQLFASASGTKILHPSPGRVAEVKVRLPPVDEQQRIASCLSALDDKIAVNERISAITMELLRARFSLTMNESIRTVRL